MIDAVTLCVPTMDAVVVREFIIDAVTFGNPIIDAVTLGVPEIEAVIELMLADKLPDAMFTFNAFPSAVSRLPFVVIEIICDGIMFYNNKYWIFALTVFVFYIIFLILYQFLSCLFLLFLSLMMVRPHQMWWGYNILHMVQ